MYMPPEMINNKVWKDYRDNILFDKDNPILAFKANRDRYTNIKNQNEYAGYAQIGSINSEDALTWNVFRGMSELNDYSSIERMLEFPIKNPNILVWLLALNEPSNDLQYFVGKIIREIDGKYKGQITEPDVIIETENKIIVIECKLGEFGKFPGHLWNTDREDGPQKRYNDYFIDNVNPFVSIAKNNIYYLKTTYQLFRMAFYAYLLGVRKKKEPVLCSLTNNSWWQIERGGNSPETIWKQFCGFIDNNKLILKSFFWQDFKFSKESKLFEYLLKHECLNTIIEK